MLFYDRNSSAGNTMGLNKFVAMFHSTSSSDCNNNNNQNCVKKLTYSSELDIYASSCIIKGVVDDFDTNHGHMSRYKRALLWSSLRIPKKYKGN